MKRPQRPPALDALRPLDSLKPNPANPKEHDLGAIIEAIRVHGFVDAPVIDDRTGRILGGHGRVEALKAMQKDGQPPPRGILKGDKDWLVPVQHTTTANDRQAAKLMLALNRTVEKGGMDDAKLSILLKAMAEDKDFEGSGYDGDDLDQLLKDLGQDEPGKEVEVPAPRRSPSARQATYGRWASIACCAGTRRSPRTWGG